MAQDEVKIQYSHIVEYTYHCHQEHRFLVGGKELVIYIFYSDPCVNKWLTSLLLYCQFVFNCVVCLLVLFRIALQIADLSYEYLSIECVYIFSGFPATREDRADFVIVRPGAYSSFMSVRNIEEIIFIKVHIYCSIVVFIIYASFIEICNWKLVAHVFIAEQGHHWFRASIHNPTSGS